MPIKPSLGAEQRGSRGTFTCVRIRSITSRFVITASSSIVAWHTGHCSTLIPSVRLMSSDHGTYDVVVRERHFGASAFDSSAFDCGFTRSCCARRGSLSSSDRRVPGTILIVGGF